MSTPHSPRGSRPSSPTSKAASPEQVSRPNAEQAVLVPSDAGSLRLVEGVDGTDTTDTCHADKNPLPFAPPCLKHGDVVISQTPNILLYLATHISAPVDLDSSGAEGAEPAKKKAKASAASVDDPATFHANELALTILDLNNEAHDTHHPVSVGSYYEVSHHILSLYWVL